jgi:hypothetical protein
LHCQAEKWHRRAAPRDFRFGFLQIFGYLFGLIASSRDSFREFNQELIEVFLILDHFLGFDVLEVYVKFWKISQDCPKQYFYWLSFIPFGNLI